MKESRWKQTILRMLVGYAATVTVTMMIMFINMMLVIAETGDMQALPLVPSFAAYFENPYLALFVQLILCGLIGMSFSGASMIFSLERWSMVCQMIVYFIVTAVTWIPVCIFCFGLGRYPEAFWCVLISMLFTYTTSLAGQILYYRKVTREINGCLSELHRGEEQVAE